MWRSTHFGPREYNGTKLALRTTFAALIWEVSESRFHWSPSQFTNDYLSSEPAYATAQSSLDRRNDSSPRDTAHVVAPRRLGLIAQTYRVSEEFVHIRPGRLYCARARANGIQGLSVYPGHRPNKERVRYGLPSANGAAHKHRDFRNTTREDEGGIVLPSRRSHRFPAAIKEPRNLL